MEKNNPFYNNPLSANHYSGNMRRRPNVGLLLGQRRRRWGNSKPTLCQRLVFAGYDRF